MPSLDSQRSDTLQQKPDSDPLRATQALALHLMCVLGNQELGEPLQARGWQFRFDRARRRLGSCHWSTGRRATKRITVSRHFALELGPHFSDDQGLLVIEDVIRHEIAHAIDFEARGRSDHGPRWKQICRRVGADPTRLYESAQSLPALPGKYLARCPACGREVTYYRRPSRPRACRSCCESHADGRFDRRFELQVFQRY